MPPGDPPLIVGAGPVGLGAALFLARAGRPMRLVEVRNERSPYSKALAINPRTLEILEPAGVTARLLELGRPIRGAQFHRRGRIIARLDFTGIHPRYPFMLALSQATTERLLAEALRAAGGTVERGVRMIGCRHVADGVEATLEQPEGGTREVVRCPWLLAADGAHSTAREQLGIAFAGSSFDDAWHLADAPLRTRLAADHAHVHFLEHGAFLFMLRVIEGTPDDERDGEPLWRVMANRPGPRARLVCAEQTGPPVWESSFRIAHRVAATMTDRAVHLAGDAAHIHSPVGARGMNLGLEDAWVFAALARAGRLADYDGLRRPVVRRVVRRVERLSRVAAAATPRHALARRFLLPLGARLPMIRRRMIATVTGLDHGLPSVGH